MAASEEDEDLIQLPPLMAGQKLERQVTRSGFDEGEPSQEGEHPAVAGGSFVATSPVKTGSSIEVKLGGITNPGGDKENQDDYFIFQSSDRSVIATGVLDGHGRELGQVASRVATQAMKDMFRASDIVDKIRVDAQAAFEQLFSHAHEAIREAFLSHYERAGMEAKSTEEGYLLVRHPRSSTWSCVHGGTTATVCVLLDGRWLYTANVGDSTALMAGWPVCLLSGNALDGLAAGAGAGAQTGAGAAATDSTPTGPTAAWEPVSLSVDHSPESASEFERVRAFRRARNDPQRPELKFVYDSLEPRPKFSCPPIFALDAGGGASVTNHGAYYKNVRGEWASLVSTPQHALFQDALAFTRSVGDFHLQTYGVRCLPDVQCVDLGAVAARATGPACLIVATDGVWDNWTYEDAVAQVRSYIDEVAARDDATTAAAKFMDLNYTQGIHNFGRHADNMTAVLLYLYPRTAATAAAGPGAP